MPIPFGWKEFNSETCIDGLWHYLLPLTICISIVDIKQRSGALDLQGMAGDSVYEQ